MTSRGVDRLRRVVPAAYLAVVLVASVMLVYRATPMTGLDETYHFRRALQVSEGGFLPRRLGPDAWGGKLDRHLLLLGDWFADALNGHRIITPASEAAAGR